MLKWHYITNSISFNSLIDNFLNCLLWICHEMRSYMQIFGHTGNDHLWHLHRRNFAQQQIFCTVVSAFYYKMSARGRYGVPVTLLSVMFQMLHTNSFTQVFHSTLILISSGTVVVTTLDTVKMLQSFQLSKFQRSVHKSVKKFSFSFAFDAPTLWNNLSEKMRPFPMIGSFRQKLKAYLSNKACPP